MAVLRGSVRRIDRHDSGLRCISRWLCLCLTNQITGRWFGVVGRRSWCQLGGAGCGSGTSAERIAEAEEDSTKQREGKEDAKNGGGSKRDLTVVFGGFVKIMFGFISGVHG